MECKQGLCDGGRRQVVCQGVRRAPSAADARVQGVRLRDDLRCLHAAPGASALSLSPSLSNRSSRSLSLPPPLSPSPAPSPRPPLYAPPLPPPSFISIAPSFSLFSLSATALHPPHSCLCGLSSSSLPSTPTPTPNPTLSYALVSLFSFPLLLLFLSTSPATLAPHVSNFVLRAFPNTLSKEGPLLSASGAKHGAFLFFSLQLSLLRLGLGLPGSLFLSLITLLPFSHPPPPPPNFQITCMPS